MMENKKIYVVDDDPEIGILLQAYLNKNGFQVACALDGLSFLEAITHDPSYDLVVLDIMLPDIDGFEVCRRLRTFSQIPVIMLTANSDETDRIIGLELGADDYLAKPFNPRELLARIKAILRRSSTKENPVTSKRYYQFAGFQLDITCRELLDSQANKVTINGSDYELLILFLQSLGETLSREVIADSTRGREAAPLDRFVDMHVSRLRNVLSEDAKNPVIIKTVRGKGYVLTVPVEHSDVSIF
ncbi:MAG: two-component system OmpR family response regulator [Oceanospirillaceae bacterium]|jgi:two-component system OmpR family response regulator